VPKPRELRRYTGQLVGRANSRRGHASREGFPVSNRTSAIPHRRILLRDGLKLISVLPLGLASIFGRAQAESGSRTIRDTRANDAYRVRVSAANLQREQSWPSLISNGDESQPLTTSSQDQQSIGKLVEAMLGWYPGQHRYWRSRLVGTDGMATINAAVKC
jgi:hypothetical protein